MGRLLEELDYRLTPMGPISLRRRWVAAIDRDVVEVMLGDEHLMSSLFTEGEIALATLGLDRTTGSDLRVVVGGLGLGYTARAALDCPRVGSVTVVDALEAVIDWHRDGLVPMGLALGSDPRCRLVHADFFALFDEGTARTDEPWDAILLDIDHSPERLLHPSHARFYDLEGLSRVRKRLRPGGVFALWSDDAPEPSFLARLQDIFANPTAHVVEFDNPLTGLESRCTIYVAGGE